VFIHRPSTIRSFRADIDLSRQLNLPLGFIYFGFFASIIGKSILFIAFETLSFEARP
jgi:hypothetical protein